MKTQKFTYSVVFVLLVLFTTLSCSKKVSEANLEADKAAIKEVLNQYAVACNTGEFDLWMSLWADDGVQMPPDTPSKIGKEQIREAMKPVFDQFDYDITINNINDAKVYGDLGLTRSVGTVKMTPKAGGDTITAVTKALTLYERQSDGSWKIIYDCFNSNIAPISE